MQVCGENATNLHLPASESDRDCQSVIFSAEGFVICRLNHRLKSMPRYVETRATEKAS